MPNNIFKFALFASLLMHAFVVYQHLEREKARIAESRADNAKKLRVIFVPKKEVVATKLQIVESEDTNNNKTPDKAKYLGKKDQSFERQTVAKNIGAFKSGKGSTQNANPAKKVTHQKVKRGFGKITFEDLSQQAVAIEKFSPTHDKNLAKTSPSSTSDYVEDIPLGDTTHLNTVEFKFYGFYHRIRQKLEQYWGNSLREKADSLAKQGRRIASNTDKITSLAIYIDTKGNIVKIQLKGTSGVKELDDAAIESFNKAGPFPNPPQGMMDNGMAVIEWGFVVKG